MAVLIIPYCIKGGMTTKLIQNKSDSKSYYEVRVQRGGGTVPFSLTDMVR